MKKRVVAFIDGFNVYHSVAELGSESNHLKWLDLTSLVRALIHPNRDELASIEYFSAVAHWNPADKRTRHTEKEVFFVTTNSRIRNAKELRETSNGFISIDERNFARNLFPKEVAANGIRVTRPTDYETSD